MQRVKFILFILILIGAIILVIENCADNNILRKASLDSTQPTIEYNGIAYHFSNLTEPQKIVYNSILTGIRNYDKTIEIPLVTPVELNTIFSHVKYDNPLLFNIDTTYKYRTRKGKMTFISTYLYDRHTTEIYKKQIDNYLKNFDEAKDYNDFDKALFVNDYFVNNYEYDYSFKKMSDSVLGLILDGKAVCSGISYMAKLVFDYLDVYCLIVEGKAKNPNNDQLTEAHAWNIIKVGNNFFHLDLTWNICISDKTIRYDYFMLCDNEIQKDHIITSITPACNISNYDFYTLNNMSINGLSQFAQYAERNLRFDRNSMIVKIKNQPFSDTLPTQILEIATRAHLNIYNRSIDTYMRYNKDLMVFEFNFEEKKPLQVGGARGG
jgi:hypothetical protein